jgi:hypothetical protein
MQAARRDPYGFLRLGRMIDRVGDRLPDDAERIATLKSIIDDLAKLAAKLDKLCSQNSRRLH